MTHTLKLALFSAALGTSAAQAEVPLREFTLQTLEQIEARHAGEPFLLVLWSVQCAPCLAELDLVREALGATPELAIELVATDAPDLRADVEESLERFGLAAHASWQFAETMPEKLRFQIDPAWYGELPRSYFYDATHQRTGHSGALTREQLQEWLSQTIRSAE